MLEEALGYAARGWAVVPLHGIESSPVDPNLRWCSCRKSIDCPTPGKHPRIKLGKGYAAASTDSEVIRGWWGRWPEANIGVITGSRSRLAVVDVDGVKGAELLKELVGAREWPATLVARSGREGGGVHFYFSLGEGVRAPTNSGGGLDIRGENGLVVAPPSRHVSGSVYAWVDERAEIAEAPAWLLEWFAGRPRSVRTTSLQNGRPAVDVRTTSLQSFAALGAPPAWIKSGGGLAARAAASERLLTADVAAALALIENKDLGWDEWNKIGMAAWRASEGQAFAAFDAWSRKSAKYEEGGTRERWEHYATSPPDSVGAGTLIWRARQVVPGWEPPSRTAARDAGDEHTRPGKGINGHVSAQDLLPTIEEARAAGSPLIQLNEKYAVIGDVGSKCLVLGYVTSKVDAVLQVPSFQTFKTFSERYSHQYVQVKKETSKGEIIEEAKQLGAQWLKWKHRRSFEGIDLVPGEGGVLPNGYLNLWKGFAVEGVSGNWDLMKAHILDVLAAGEVESARYILAWAAWAVQNPGEPAEVALVFKGGKGSGKGTFARCLKQLFGQHGLQIYNSKHLVGSFNAHLRNCLLLYADEAFWAGDKQGESVLKGMVTEPTLMIEQKGVDAQAWRNRLHIVMTANAEWVVPASHDERRYAMFDVSNARIDDEAYFQALYNELGKGGGGAAMLADLLGMNLGGWHPRKGILTDALKKQKLRSLDPRFEWYESVLQSGFLPVKPVLGLQGVSLELLLNAARGTHPRLRDTSTTAFGLMLRECGWTNQHTQTGNLWSQPALRTAREAWRTRFGMWKWHENIPEWG